MEDRKYSPYSKEQVMNNNYQYLCEYLLTNVHDLETKRKMERNFI